MPRSPILCSPSRLSVTLNTTQAAKKAVKSVKNVVKHGAAAISRPFKKRRKSSSSGGSVSGDSRTDSRKCFISHLHVFTYIYITVDDGNSTKEPSVIDIDDEDGGKSVDETLEEELGKS
jgi:hypothetical protein